jgi:UDPglucose 6-dehydrogenase
MAQIAISGASGYVGLNYAAFFADLGHSVVGIGLDPVRIGLLNRGVVPIHEPGLEQLVHAGLATGRLRFTTDYGDAIPEADFVFICVGTPGTASGAADTTAIIAAAQELSRHSRGHTYVVNKSTMPVGSVRFVTDILAEHAPPGATFTVVANPEFLREGSAVHDVYHPDRIVLGADNPEDAAAVGQLYSSIKAPVLITEPESAEMIKYASNAFLATKISFINEVAVICERLGADISVVAQGMGLDQRINPRFLEAGIGFGGSCFPKDVRALATMAQKYGCDSALLSAVLDTNTAMRTHVVQRLTEHLGPLTGKVIAVLGLAFKPETDDVRESPSIALIQHLLASGAIVRATDPAANGNAARSVPEAHIEADGYQAVMGADAVIVATEWPVFASLNFERIANAMRGRLVIDGRNFLDPDTVQRAGLVYEGIGRAHRSAPEAPSTVTSIIVSPVPARKDAQVAD